MGLKDRMHFITRDFSDIKGSLVPLWLLYPGRVTSPARAKMLLPFKPLADSSKEFEIKELLSGCPISDDRVLYIHLPFCRQSCSFCGYYKEFHSVPGVVDRYITGIASQLKALRGYRWFSDRNFQAVYFGGGSPSSLNLVQLSSLIGAVKRFVPLSSETEITVEMTTADINSGLMKNLVEMGVNRISVGVQSFNTDLRQNLGRLSTGEEVQSAINICHDAGITNLCIDLIYNLPGQTLGHWETDLQLLSALPVTGCSVYPLIPFPDSSLVRSGRFLPQSPEEEYRYFKMADDHLNAMPGWQSFSPVQFGHSILGKPIYIMAQGQQSDLLALGPSAGGRINQYQYLSKYSLENCLSPDFDLVQNSSWSKISLKYLKFRQLYSLSEGQALSEDALAKAGITFNDLFPDCSNSPLFDAADSSFMLTQAGRYWAGNISQRITDKICNLIQP